MTFPFIPGRPGNRRASGAEQSLMVFLHEHRQALLSAAGLLGDRGGVALVQGLFDSAACGGLHARSVRRQLSALLALLSLEHAGDPERIESGCFAEIDPWDPRIEEICLLTDGFRRALDDFLRDEQMADADKEPTLV